MFSVKTLLVLSAIMATTVSFNLSEFTDLDFNEITTLQDNITNQNGYRCEFIEAKKYKTGKYEYYAALIESDDSNGDCFMLFMVNFADNPPAMKFYDDQSEGFEEIHEAMSGEVCSADVQVGMFGQFSIRYPKLSQIEIFNKQSNNLGLYKLGMGEKSEQDLILEAQVNEMSLGGMSQMKKLAKGNNYGSWSQIRGESAEEFWALFENTMFKNKVGEVYRTNAGSYVYVIKLKGEEEYNCKLWLKDLGYPKGYEIFPEESRPMLKFPFIKEIVDCSMQLHEHILSSLNQQSLIVFKPKVYEDNVWYKSKNGIEGVSATSQIFGFGSEYKFSNNFGYLKKEKRRFYVGEVIKRNDQMFFVACLLFLTTPTGNTKDLILLKVPTDHLTKFGRDLFPSIEPCSDQIVIGLKSAVSERRVFTYINSLTTASNNGVLKPGFSVLANEELNALKQMVESKYSDFVVRGGLEKAVAGGKENIVLVTYFEGMNYCKIVIFVSEDGNTIKIGSPATSKTKAYDSTFVNADNCNIDMFKLVTTKLFVPERRLLLI